MAVTCWIKGGYALFGNCGKLVEICDDDACKADGNLRLKELGHALRDFREAKTERSRVGQSNITIDDASTFKCAHASQTGRRT